MKTPLGFVTALLALTVTTFDLKAACSEVFYWGARDGGYYTRDGVHESELTELRAGGDSANASYPLRNWLLFDLPASHRTASDARLYIPQFVHSSAEILRLEVFDVTTSLQVLTNGGSGLQNVYADLGTGIKLGEVTFSTSDGAVTVPLSSQALAYLNDPSNITFALGGRLSTLASNSNTPHAFISSFAQSASLIFQYDTTGAPVFTQPTLDLQMVAGTWLQLSAPVCGAPTIAYQWFHNGNLLAGQTNALFNVPSVDLSHVGTYTVSASNTFGVVTGAVATVQVDAARLSWSIVPPNPLYVGNPALFQVQVLTSAPFTYLVVHNTTNILEATVINNVINFQIPAVTPADAGEYFVVVGNEYGVAISPPIFLNPIYSGPQISSQSGSPIIVNAGETSYLYAYAVGGPRPSVQWYFENELIPGATREQLEVRYAQRQHSGTYRLMASNEFGIAWSAPIVLAVGSFTPTIYSLNNLTVVEGATATFVPTVFGSPPLSYQWHFNNVAIPGANRLELTLFNVAALNAGTYRLDVNQPVSASASATLTLRPAGPLDHWIRLTPHPTATYLHDVTFTGERFLAVGENGAIVASGPNNSWSQPFSSTRAHLRSVAFGNGVHVAVANDAILYSADGEQWSRASYTFPRKLNSASVAFASGRFMILANELVEGPVGFQPVLTSTDGVNWQRSYIEVPAGYDLKLVATSDRFFVFRQDEVYSSQDGISWSLIDRWFIGRRDMAFSNNLWVSVGFSGSVRTSDNLSDWVERSVPGDNGLLSVAYGNGKWVAVGTRGGVFYSSDAVTWTKAHPPNLDRLEGIAFGNGRFIAVGEAGTLFASTDGVTWSLANSGPTSDMEALTSGPDRLVAVGKEGWVLTSTNGIDFNAHYSGGTNLLHDVVYAQGQYLGVGDEGRIARSTDGVNWVNSTVDTNAYLKGVTYGEGRFVTVGSNGRIFSSTDGVQWVPRDPNIIFFRDFNSVAYGNGVFVAAGDNGAALFSEDGFQWYFSSPQGAAVNLRDVVFVNNRFMMAGNDGILYSSTNGYTWTFHFTFPRQDGMNLRSITYAHGMYIIVGNRGLVLTSRDLNSWQIRRAETLFNLHGVQPWGDRFVAIGNGGTAMLSGFIRPWLAATKQNAVLKVTLEAEPAIYQVQSSSNLVDWVPAFAVTNESLRSTFNVPVTGGRTRFLRAVTP